MSKDYHERISPMSTIVYARYSEVNDYADQEIYQLH